MADCQYCLKVGNHYINTELDKFQFHQVEIEVVDDQKPYLMVRGLHSNKFADWTIGVQIKYCPMCGRRLNND
jgi:hypothetical protein